MRAPRLPSVYHLPNEEPFGLILRFTTDYNTALRQSLSFNELSLSLRGP
jgi:hypothetical protein